MNIIPWKNKGNGNGAAELPVRRDLPTGEDFESLVQRFFDDPWSLSPWSGLPAAGASRFVPRLEMTETGDEVLVRVELPGIDPAAIDLAVAGDVLTISGEKTTEREGSQESHLLSERSYGSFSRSVTLPGHVDTAKVEATYEHGVLTVRLPRTADARPRKIKVKAS